MGGWMDERMVKSSSIVSLLITSIKTLVFYLICWDFFLLPSGKRKKKLLKMTNISKHGCILWITLKSLGNEIKKKAIKESKLTWRVGSLKNNGRIILCVQMFNAWTPVPIACHHPVPAAFESLRSTRCWGNTDTHMNHWCAVSKWCSPIQPDVNLWFCLALLSSHSVELTHALETSIQNLLALFSFPEKMVKHIKCVLIHEMHLAKCVLEIGLFFV